MKKINILPWRENLKEEKQKQNLIVCYSIISITFVLLIIFHSYFIFQTSYLNTKLKSLEQSISKQSGVNKQMAHIVEQQNRIIIEQELVKSTLFLLSDFPKNIPTGITIKTISYKSKKLNTEGLFEKKSDVTLLKNLYQLELIGEEKESKGHHFQLSWSFKKNV